MSPTRSSPRASEDQITASQPCDPVQNDPCHDDPERENCKNTPRRADSVSWLFHSNLWRPPVVVSLPAGAPGWRTAPAHGEALPAAGA